MIPSSKDLILQKKVKLYNNLANIDNCQGRLLAELEIYPNPRIVWDFEVLGDTNNFPYWAGGINSEKSLKINGHAFSIEQESVLFNDLKNDVGPRNALRGSTKKAIYGDLQNSGNVFGFYLPNTIYQSKRSNQESKNDRYSIDVPIDKSWNIYLCIDKEAREWLDPKNRNIGSLITAVGTLYSPGSNSDTSDNFSENLEITLENAVKRIQNICLLLSYVNGGWVSPLYIEGYKQKNNGTNFSCAIALASHTTPLEKVGLSWFTNQSDLKNFLECIPAFEKMIDNDSWKETFDFALIQYFQAIQVGLVGWPVIASAVGAALERLSYIILVLEEPDLGKRDINELLFTRNKGEKQKQYDQQFQKDEYKKQDNKYLSPTGIRLICLLNRIGLTEDNNPDVVQSFLDIRNDAVHPRVSNMDLDERKKMIVKAIQWIDEIILWRIGYSGQYRDRTQAMESSINPRYNLTLRDSNW